MHHLLGGGGSPEIELVILTSVILGAEGSHPVQKAFPEGGKMADIVVGQEIFRGIIRLEVDELGMGRGPGENQLIRVKKIGSGLVDGLGKGEQRSRMEQIVMVKQADIIPRSHGQAGVGVAGNPQILG